MKAVVLAAGEGKRLRPFTETMPKVMLPVANKPIIEYVFDAIKNTLIDEVIVVVGYKKEVIMEYFKDYKDVKITYVVQDKQLGTGHALLQSKKHIKNDFIVIPGDNIIDKNSIEKLLYEESKYALLVKEHSCPSKYGVIYRENNSLKRIVEKPKSLVGKFISTGIYKFPNSIFTYLKDSINNGNFGIPSTIQTLLDQNKIIKTVEADQWMDIVYPWDLININEIIMSGISDSIGGIIEKGVVIKGSVSIGKDTIVYPGCCIMGPVIIGKNCEIGPNVCIFPSTAIADNVVINSFCEIRNSLIFDDSNISSHSIISQSIIGRGNIIGNNLSSSPGDAIVEVDNELVKMENMGSMIGEHCKIGNNVILEPGIIIGKNCKIASMKNINKNIPTEGLVI